LTVTVERFITKPSSGRRDHPLGQPTGTRSRRCDRLGRRTGSL